MFGDKASKTGSEEKAQDKANETQPIKEREDGASDKRKAGKQPPTVALDLFGGGNMSKAARVFSAGAAFG